MIGNQYTVRFLFSFSVTEWEWWWGGGNDIQFYGIKINNASSVFAQIMKNLI